MAHEIERKFLIKNEEWRKLTKGILYRQGYLSTIPERTVRVRVVGENAYLTVKGLTKGLTRVEFEYEIPLLDANQMLDQLCERPIIEKLRHKLDFAGFTWEIDEYLGENQGLIIAEVELDDEKDYLELPSWVGEEVSDDPKYFNASLVTNPFHKW
ncbi:MAG: CYTH domain-containing protein [Acidobacteria bacterium]|nr:CYTH domain-containing protein [Acidobacteriota bacterium]